MVPSVVKFSENDEDSDVLVFGFNDGHVCNSGWILDTAHELTDFLLDTPSKKAVPHWL